jgi:hypothetical protein
VVQLSPTTPARLPPPECLADSHPPRPPVKGSPCSSPAKSLRPPPRTPTPAARMTSRPGTNRVVAGRLRVARRRPREAQTPQRYSAMPYDARTGSGASQHDASPRAASAGRPASEAPAARSRNRSFHRSRRSPLDRRSGKSGNQNSKQAVAASDF